MAFSPSAKQHLTRHDLGRFPTDRLFDRVARAVCTAECLPRKELYEAWEVARRVRRVFRGGRIVDVAGGHGLLASLLLLLDDSSPDARVVDPVTPSSAQPVGDALVSAWPRLGGRVHREATTIDRFAVAPGDLVVSSHACGGLTDRVLAAAAAVRARVGVLPCCHDIDTCDAGSIGGWVDATLAIDLQRAWRLEQAGYRVWTQIIPAAITPKNRLLLGQPTD